MVNIVEAPLYQNERNLLSFVLVSFAKLQQMDPGELHYSFDRDNYSLRLYIEYEDGLIQFLHSFNERYYQLSRYPNKGSRFNRLTQESLDKIMSELTIHQSKKFIFYA